MSRPLRVFTAALLFLTPMAPAYAQPTRAPGSYHETICAQDPNDVRCTTLDSMANVELFVRAAGAVASDAASAAAAPVTNTFESARLALGGTPLGGAASTPSSASAPLTNPWAGVSPPTMPPDNDPFAQPMDRLQRTENANRLVARDRAITDALREHCRPADPTPACPEVVDHLNELHRDFNTFNANPTTARQGVSPLRQNSLTTASLINLPVHSHSDFHMAPNAPTLAPLPAVATNSASISGRRFAETLPTYMHILAARCGDLRRAAVAEAFGVNATAEHGVAFDQRLAPPLASDDLAALAEGYQAFDDTTQQAQANPAANAYARCLYSARLKQLDPDVDLAAVARGEYPPDPDAPQPQGAWAAALTRQGGAGTSVLAQSIDPTQRADRQALRAQQLRDRDTRVAQRRADSAAFWDGVLQFAATAAVVGLQTYATVETARMQDQAQAVANQAYSPPPAAAQSQYSNQQPAAQRPSTQQRSFVDPNTGQPCVQMTGQEFDGHAYRVFFRNTCNATFSVRGEMIPANGQMADPVQGNGIGPNGTSNLTCTNSNGSRSCAGFSRWWVQ